MNTPPRNINWGYALKQSAIAAIVTFVLLSVLLGISIFQNANNDTMLKLRPALLIGFSLFAAAFRFLIILKQSLKTTQTKTKQIGWFEKIEPYLQPILIGLMAFFPLIIVTALGAQGSTKWIDNYGIVIMIYIMLGWGLNIVVGLAGLLDLGYVAFYAIGSYTYALLAQHYGFSFWMALPVAGVMAAMWGILLGFPVLRLRGDYLAVVTMAFGEIIRSVAVNWKDLTGGGAGISVPKITFFGLPFNANDDGFAAYFGLEFLPIHRSIFLYYVIFILAIFTAFITIKLKKLPIGRAWEALREDEIACRSLGVNTRNTKLTAFAIGALFGGLAGAFFGARQGFLTPESFSFEESVLILATVVFGGMGSLTGVVLASIALFGGMEILREFSFVEQFIGIDPNRLRMLVVGLGMVLMMLWKPRGLISTRTPTVYLKTQKSVSGSLVKEGHG
jgi:branched-chain amino acid transport system permease protein